MFMGRADVLYQKQHININASGFHRITEFTHTILLRLIGKLTKHTSQRCLFVAYSRGLFHVLQMSQ